MTNTPAVGVLISSVKAEHGSGRERVGRGEGERDTGESLKSAISLEYINAR